MGCVSDVDGYEARLHVEGGVTEPTVQAVTYCEGVHVAREKTCTLYNLVAGLGHVCHVATVVIVKIQMTKYCNKIKTTHTHMWQEWFEHLSFWHEKNLRNESFFSGWTKRRLYPALRRTDSIRPRHPSVASTNFFDISSGTTVRIKQPRWNGSQNSNITFQSILFLLLTALSKHQSI